MKLGFDGTEHAIGAYLLVVCALAFGTVFGRFAWSHDTVTVHVKRVPVSWGRPDQTVDGAQVNPQLQGFRCEIYEKRQVVLCHR